MAKLTLGGREYDIAPYKLGDLRKAAVHIDAINASVGSPPTFEVALENIGHAIEALAIGMQRLDASFSAEALMEMVGQDEIAAINAAYAEFLRENGFAPKGEGKAPSVTEPEGA